MDPVLELKQEFSGLDLFRQGSDSAKVARVFRVR